MAEREESKIPTSDGAQRARVDGVEDGESSASAYAEEIVEKVTDNNTDDNEAETPEVNAMKKLQVDKNVVTASTSAAGRDDVNVVVLVTTPQAPKDEHPQRDCKRIEEIGKVAGGCETGPEQTANGESLLPFLQGLLHKNSAQGKPATAGATGGSYLTHANVQTMSQRFENNLHDATTAMPVPRMGLTAHKDKDALATVDNNAPIIAPRTEHLHVPQREDSGTESGEDLRLIAAGIRHKLQLEGDTNLIEEVTRALNRLEKSLREGRDISVDERKRNTLLALVERLQVGLLTPDKLHDAGNEKVAAGGGNGSGNGSGSGGINHGETSSPEADAYRTSRQRFAKKRNRNSRYTVGVSREELEDARRYMEDMLLIENLSNCTTPDGGGQTPAASNWFPVEKNNSAAAILGRPHQCVANGGLNASLKPHSDGRTNPKEPMTVRKPSNRRPLSGDYSTAATRQEDNSHLGNKYPTPVRPEPPPRFAGGDFSHESPETSSKFNRFSNKKLLMKRANTIDIPKAKQYSLDYDTDSEAESKGPGHGLKRAVQVSVRPKVASVVPPFEPKTENDHKFLAFINRQSVRPGLGWNNAKSVSNWSKKFGNIKNAFEIGANNMTVNKPPPVPLSNAAFAPRPAWNKNGGGGGGGGGGGPQQLQCTATPRAPLQEDPVRRRLLEEERIQRLERNRVEHEHARRTRAEQIQREQRMREERLKKEFYDRQATAVGPCCPDAIAIRPAPINKFIHAPQSVFKPIDSPAACHGQWSGNANDFVDDVHHVALKPMPPMVNCASPSSTSPIGAPWASKKLPSTAFRNKASMFEERNACMDNCRPMASNVYRQHSLRVAKDNECEAEYHRKRPSLPNASDECIVTPHGGPRYEAKATLPPPTNVSFTYSDYGRPVERCDRHVLVPRATATSLVNLSRCREDSLTNPQAAPLILSSVRPLYNPHLSNVHLVNSAPNTPTLKAFPRRQDMELTLDEQQQEQQQEQEYRVESKVMKKPQCQTAVTVGRRTNRTDEERGEEKGTPAADNLLHIMQTIAAQRSNETATAATNDLLLDGQQQNIVTDARGSYQGMQRDRVTLTNKYDAMHTDAGGAVTSAPPSLRQYHSDTEYVAPRREQHAYNYHRLKDNRQRITQPQSQPQPQPQLQPQPQPQRDHVQSTMSQHSHDGHNIIVSAMDRGQRGTDMATDYHPHEPFAPLDSGTMHHRVHPNRQQATFNQIPSATFLRSPTRHTDNMAWSHAIAERDTRETLQSGVFLEDVAEVQRKSVKSLQFDSKAELGHKSSAPMDTPDIVKSSLPKDEYAPLLKKYGPPQRHHYTPNAYQSPLEREKAAATKTIVQSSIVTSKPTVVNVLSSTPLHVDSTEDLIPRNIVYNNISAFTMMSQHRAADSNQAAKYTKWSSWKPNGQHGHLAASTAAAASVSTGVLDANANGLRRTKSGNTLHFPKMYEAGIDQAQMGEKQRTVAAYFSGKKSPPPTRRTTINRTRTSEKTSASRKSFCSLAAHSHDSFLPAGLARSATMPHIAHVSLLDETNVEDAFDKLLQSS